MRLLLGLAALALSTAAIGQGQVVGRVLLSAGDTFAVRDGREVRLAFNSPIEFRDTLRTGAASSMQVRFVDESLLSLRDNTDFQIEEYQFAAKQDVGSERAFFRLIKGGFRAVTGAIGRTQNANYRVQTQTATIGIRGTDYAVRACAGDCGANVKDGVYGTVLGLSNGTNQITVTNQATPQPATFGINQHFYVASPNAAPQQLLQPPTFVAVKPQGKAQAAQQGGQGTGSETASEGSGASAESRPQSVIDASASVIQPVGLTDYSVQNTAAGGIGIGDVAFGGCGGDASSMGSNCGGGLTFLSSISFGTQGGIPIITEVRNVVEHIGQADQSSFSATKGSLPVVNPGCVSSTIAGCTVPNDSSFNAYFGRWQDGTLTDNTGTKSFNSTAGNSLGLHYIAGTSLTPFDAITSKTGSAVFNTSLGTNPTNNFGQTGSASFGNLNVNFGPNPSGTLTSFTMSFSPSAQLPSGQTYTFSNLPMKIFSEVGGKIAFIEFQNFTTGITGACAGTCGSTQTFLDMGGPFVGALGRHVGMTVETRNGSVVTGQVRLFNCTSGNC